MILNANVKCRDAVVDGQDVKKIKNRYPAMPSEQLDKLKRVYPSLQRSMVDVYENGVGCVITSEWSCIIADNDQKQMEQFWQDVIMTANANRSEQLTPNLPAINITHMMEAFEENQKIRYSIILTGDKNRVNSGNTKNSHNKNNSDNTINK